MYIQCFYIIFQLLGKSLKTHVKREFSIIFVGMYLMMGVCYFSYCIVLFMS